MRPPASLAEPSKRTQQCIRTGRRLLGLAPETNDVELSNDHVLAVLNAEGRTRYEAHCIRAAVRYGTHGRDGFGERQHPFPWQPVHDSDAMREIIQKSGLPMDNKTTKWRSWAPKVREAMRFLGIQREADIMHFSLSDLEHRLSEVTDSYQRTILVNSINILMRAAGCATVLEPTDLKYELMGSLLSRAERAWLQENGQPDWYAAWKRRFARWMEDHCMASDRVRYYLFLTGCCIVRKANREPCCATAEEFGSAMVAAAVHAYQDSTQCLRRQRRSNRSGRNTPNSRLMKNYFAAYALLLDFLGVPTSARMTPQRVQALVARKCPVDVPEHTEADLLTAEEMKRALDVCADERELVIITLLSRLGMRIGALANLRSVERSASETFPRNRITGIVENYPLLAPGSTPWTVARIISGLDKGEQVNHWYLDITPTVKEVLERYLNLHWRPRYEAWECVDGQGPRLKELMVFPPMKAVNRLRNSTRRGTCMFQRIVKRVLHRAGITGPRAHCHAFRKGVVTELLSCGNPMKSVSTFVHHKTTTVTEQYYDKRSHEELVEKMIVPLGWTKLVHDVAEASSQAEVVQPAPSVTESRHEERLEYAKVMLEATQTIAQQQKRIDILMEMLPEELIDQYDAACLRDGLAP